MWLVGCSFLEREEGRGREGCVTNTSAIFTQDLVQANHSINGQSFSEYNKFVFTSSASWQVAGW